MPSTNYDLGYLTAGEEVLEKYLLSKALFWPIHSSSPLGEPEFPQLTLGNLLLSQTRLRVKNLQPEESQECRILEESISQIHDKWQTAWERKLRWEYRSRLRQWQHYINDLFQEPESNIAYYSNEVRLRLLLDLIKADMRSEEGINLDTLNLLDAELQSVFHQDQFIWERELISGFDSEKYWYLWGKPDVSKFTMS